MPSSLVTDRIKLVLVGTKLNVPPLGPRMLPRNQLIRLFSESKERRLFVISGMPGSGKTSLVSQWIREKKIPAAWYSLDREDSEPDIFYRYFLTALSNVDDILESALSPWLQSHQRLPLKEILPQVINLLSDLPKEIYLILDDYHLITSKKIHDSLLYFLEHISPNIHVVIISRYDIPISLSRFRVRKQIMEISGRDMKLNDEETEMFFSEIIPVKLSTDEVNEVTRYTEGWIGGLQLFGLYLKGKGPHDDFRDILRKTYKNTSDYLIDEVLNGQPEKIKTFLHVTSFLERFNSDLCREVTGLDDASEILGRVYRNNLFLISLDSEGIWYRYHHFFSKAVREHAKRSSSGEEVRRKAALWFSRNNYSEDAFRQAFASKNFEFAADLLEDHLFLFYERYGIASTINWLEKLPHEIFMQRALLRLYSYILKIDSLEAIDIKTALADIERNQHQELERYKGNKRNLCQDLLKYFKAISPCFQDPVNIDMGLISECLKGISPENKFCFSLIEDIVAGIQLMQGRLPPTRDALLKNVKILNKTEDIFSTMLWYRSTITSECWQGCLHRAMTTAREGLLFLERRNLSNSPLKCLVYEQMAFIYFYRNELDKAIQYGTIVEEYAEQINSANIIVNVYVTLALVYWTSGDPEKAEQYIQKILLVAKTASHLKTIKMVESLLVFYHLRKGDIPYVEQWAARRKLRMDEPFSYLFIYECLHTAELFCRKGRYQKTVQTLNALRERCMKRDMMLLVLYIDILHSGALYSLNDRDQAIKVMEQALSFAAPEGIVQPFMDFSKIISPVLIDIKGTLSDDRISSYLVTIMEACGIERNCVAIQDPSKILSQREIEILNLMSAGYTSYKKIAGKTFVSLNTIRTHVRNIYDKLDVHTRDQAIQRAEELKILNGRRN